jgi:type I restriction enzyme R subunit
MKKEIKRAILDQSFSNPGLVKVVQERFMELGKTKFGNSKGAGH